MKGNASKEAHIFVVVQSINKGGYWNAGRYLTWKHKIPFERGICVGLSVLERFSLGRHHQQEAKSKTTRQS